MLAIRLQRLGRKAYPVYRVAIQEAQRHPSSGRVVAYVGSYNPHTKATQFDADKVSLYLKNGAQPSPRVIRLLQAEKIALPDWVKKTVAKQQTTKHPDKLRKNQPKVESPAPDSETATPDHTTEAES
ncbi:MAG TPA: 30S ribosomal protein S16 [Candidatus Saccharimonadales bacterium]|jgi:small subunit ribosomal protein S16|nr:30S ribosomal protein S16 [Candidatus Saccharimonadales bacterium]